MPDDATIFALRGDHVPILKTSRGYYRYAIRWRKRRLVAQEERSAKDRWQIGFRAAIDGAAGYSRNRDTQSKPAARRLSRY